MQALQETKDLYLHYTHHSPELIGMILQAAPASIKSNLVTEMAINPKEPDKVYVKADLIPLFGYLHFGDTDEFSAREREIYASLWQMYREALMRPTPYEAREGEINAAIGYWFGLSGIEDEFMDIESKKVKVGLGTTGQGAGGALIGHWAATLAVEKSKISSLTLSRVGELYERTLRNAIERDERMKEAGEVREKVKWIKEEVLWGVLGGRWEHISTERLNALLQQQGINPDEFHQTLNSLALFISRHAPQVADALGLVDEEGEIKVSWDRLRDRIYSGIKGEKGRPTLIDTVEHIVAKMELEAMRKEREEAFWESLRKLPKESVREIAAAFKDALNSPIPVALKSFASRLLHSLEDTDETEDIKDRIENFLEAETWGEMLRNDPDALEDAFDAYLYRLGEFSAYTLKPYTFALKD